VKGLAPLAAAVLVVSAAAAREKPASKPVPVARGVAVVNVDGGYRTDARLDGSLVAWTLVGEAPARRGILVLLAQPPAPRGAGTSDATRAACSVSEENAAQPPPRPLRLARVNHRDPASIEILRDDIRGDTIAAGAFDADADGRDDLVLFRPGRVELIPAGADGRFAAEPVSIVEDSGAGPIPFEGVGGSLGPTNDPAGPRLRLPVIGALRTWGPDAARARWRILSDAPTPFRAEPALSGLRLVGPRVLSCGRDATGRAWFATEAEAVGRDRLRARLLDPDGAPESRSATCWARLPAPERVLEQTCLMLDGAPHLVVTTMSSEKLSLLGEKRLRVFPLTPDRTRTGATPRFAVASGINLWQATIPVLADVDGNGSLDLVLPYWKGLKGSTAVLEAFPRRADGAFEATARRTELDVADGEKSWIGWGQDASGDGRPDLLLFAGKNVVLYPGMASDDGRRLVSAKPSARLPWPDDAPDLGSVWSGLGGDGPVAGVQFGSLGVPVASDLDGDGRVELILVGNDADGGRLIVFEFPSGR
jgi:hypothetical protein